MNTQTYVELVNQIKLEFERKEQEHREFEQNYIRPSYKWVLMEGVTGKYIISIPS